MEHTFTTVHKKFEIRVPFNCDSKNLIYVVICSSCKEEYIEQTQRIIKERLNSYRQHTQPVNISQLDIENHIRTYCDRNFKVLSFLQCGETTKS